MNTQSSQPGSIFYHTLLRIVMNFEKQKKLEPTSHLWTIVIPWQEPFKLRVYYNSECVIAKTVK